MPKSDTEYSDKEATKRMEDALRRALNTPHKPHTQMKVKAKPSRPKKATRKAKKRA